MTFLTVGLGDLAPKPDPPSYMVLWCFLTFLGLGFTTSMVTALTDEHLNLKSALRGALPEWCWPQCSRASEADDDSFAKKGTLGDVPSAVAATGATRTMQAPPEMPASRACPPSGPAKLASSPAMLANDASGATPPSPADSAAVARVRERAAAVAAEKPSAPATSKPAAHHVKFGASEDQPEKVTRAPKLPPLDLRKPEYDPNDALAA